MKYESIQFLRFIAAFMVVTCHSFFYTSERLGVGGFSWVQGSRGVDIFFIISGFVMVVSSQKIINCDNGWAIFSWKRISRIVPMYWTATSAKLIIAIVLSEFVLHARPDFWLVLKSYFFIPSMNIDGEIKPFLGVGWTLVFEMFFYVVFTFSLYIKANVFKFVGAVLIFVSILSLFKIDNNSSWLFVADTLVLEFYMGMLLAKLIINKHFIPEKIAFIIFIVSMLFLLLSDSEVEFPKFIHDGVPAFFLVYSAISMESFIARWVPRFFIFGGAASYSIYLFHPLIAPVIPEVLKRIHFNLFSISVILTVVVSIIITSIIHKYYELPITKMINIFFHRDI
jgi:exopolysaccharide production protein ExoZ